MTLSPAADHEEPPPTPDECDHPEPEVNEPMTFTGEVEIEAYCPACETGFYAFIELDDMEASDRLSRRPAP